MVKLAKLLLTYKLKLKQPSQKTNGFTLIEVLVGLILAALVITPLLGFMVNIMQTDRQEQAKANTEQEIQAALDYIARDLEQSVFIYDAYGLYNQTNPIRDQLPEIDNSVPVLVFWKRQIVPDIIPTQRGTDDAFVYSLVAYYLTTSDPASCGANPWSCSARITRFQLKDAVKVKDRTAQDGVRTIQAADPGFEIFPTTGSSTEGNLNSWRPDGTPDLQRAQVLIDYIDQTPTSTLPPLLQPSCSTAPRSPGAFRPDAPPPPAPTPPGFETTNYEYRQVPPSPVLTQTASGFYACVDTEKTSVKIFIRGNALARLGNKANPPNYSQGKSSYFPSASIQVEGRGFLETNPNSL